MKQCKQFKEVTTKLGTTKRVCASYSDEGNDEEVVIAPGAGKLGLVVPEALQGLGNIGLEDLVGPGVGLIGTALGTVLAARFGGRIHPKIAEYAHIFGAAFGVLASIPLYYWKGKKAMISGVLSSVSIGAAMALTPWLMEKVASSLDAGKLTGLGDYGLLAIQDVGALPEVDEATSIPGSVYGSTDLGAWGSVV